MFDLFVVKNPDVHKIYLELFLNRNLIPKKIQNQKKFFFFTFYYNESFCPHLIVSLESGVVGPSGEVCVCQTLPGVDVVRIRS